MLRRAAAAVDGFDIVIVVALALLGVGVAGEFGLFSALIAVGAALLAFVAISLWTAT